MTPRDIGNSMKAPYIPDLSFGDLSWRIWGKYLIELGPEKGYLWLDPELAVQIKPTRLEHAGPCEDTCLVTWASGFPGVV